jgi:hypothetical protein
MEVNLYELTGISTSFVGNGQNEWKLRELLKILIWKKYGTGEKFIVS